MKLNRSENSARWFAIVACCLIGAAALWDSYASASAGQSWMKQLLDGVLLLSAGAGFILKKRFGPTLYFLLAAIQLGGTLANSKNPSFFFGALAGAAIPLVIASYLFRAFGRTPNASTDA